MLTIDFQKLAIVPGDRILDIGCGEGRHIITACQKDKTICIGADSDFSSLVKTRKKVDFHLAIDDLCCKTIDFSSMDITTLPFKDSSIDTIICSEVLEHIADDAGAISELVRILKPGKILAVSVPRFWPEKICWLLSEDYSNEKAGHVRIYKKNSLIQTIESFGLNFCSFHYAHSIHAPFWWLKCLVGPNRTDSKLVDLYHRFLVWDLMKKPKLTAFIDKILNPVCGKSLVLYFKKNNNGAQQ